MRVKVANKLYRCPCCGTTNVGKFSIVHIDEDFEFYTDYDEYMIRLEKGLLICFGTSKRGRTEYCYTVWDENTGEIKLWDGRVQKELNEVN